MTFNPAKRVNNYIIEINGDEVFSKILSQWMSPTTTSLKSLMTGIYTVIDMDSMIGIAAEG